MYTEKTPTKEVAIDFGSKGSTFTTFHCGGNIVIRGAILSPVTQINKIFTNLKLPFHVNSQYEQTPIENYTENLEGMEKSFPESEWEQEGFRAFGLNAEAVASRFKKSGAEVEEKIEA